MNFVADFKNKKVLIFGLGLHGGGVASTIFMAKHGAQVAITDLRSAEILKPSLDKIIASGVKIDHQTLGQNLAEDLAWAEIIVVNPGASLENPLLKDAKDSGKIFMNEASIFLALCPASIIGVTGTRGKTTTVNWIKEILSIDFPDSVLTGNSSDYPMLKALDQIQPDTKVVAELSSYQLELVTKGPHIAIITNLSVDHLNRYGSMENYARAKANIFLGQIATDHLILNFDNEWTDFNLNLKPQAQIWFTSLKSLPENYLGIFINEAGEMIFRRPDKSEINLGSMTAWRAKYGEHNLANLLPTTLAGYLSGVSWEKIMSRINHLKNVKFRQEIIFSSPTLKIINDTAATSPAGAMAALDRFGGLNTILIAGGTDKDLDFNDWAVKIKQTIKPHNLFLLNGSATAKMIVALKAVNYTDFFLEEDFKTLIEKAWNQAQSNPENTTLLFSPGAASFEKFLHEFDRGDKFNTFIYDLANLTVRK